MKNNMLITIIAVVVVGAIAFWGGMKYQKSNASSNFNGGQFYRSNGQSGMMGNGQGQRRFGGANGGGATGEILSVDANSITVKLQDGSSKIINISNSTTYSKSATASESDLKTGERIAAFGTSNSDGSITAQNIQINPEFRARQGTPSAQ